MAKHISSSHVFVRPFDEEFSRVHVSLACLKLCRGWSLTPDGVTLLNHLLWAYGAASTEWGGDDYVTTASDSSRPSTYQEPPFKGDPDFLISSKSASAMVRELRRALADPANLAHEPEDTSDEATR